ncbi:hypothetical protein IQ238_28340 [Pleurocapsales cyanobacterium LEGE 06147]|nr:hypothetical protein [Pleurocapsales cyanobacterium LEGE 06147]
MLSLKNQKITNYFSLFIFAGLCLTSIINLQKARWQAETSSLSQAEYFKQEQAQKAALNIQKKLPSFGFSNLIADWTYLQFLQYFGDGEVREKIGYSLSPDYFEAVVDRDPRFVRAYFLMSPATSIFAGEAQKGVNLIDKGLQSISPDIHPQAYYLWVYKGIDEMLFLGDTKAAQQSYEMAAQWAEQNEDPASQRSAANVRQTAQFLSEDPDSTIARIGAWTMVLSSTSDEKTQQRAIEQIQSLGGQIVISPEGGLSVRVPG